MAVPAPSRKGGGAGFFQVRRGASLKRDSDPVGEVAAVLGTSLGTVERDLRLARAWLHRELSGRRAR